MPKRKWFTNDQRDRDDAGQFEREDTLAYFIRNYEVNAVTGCWNWIGNKFNTGYGAFKNAAMLGPQKVIPASRASWIIHKGPIPEGILVRHTCDNPSCVNPDHLLLGTYKDNSNDCVTRGRINKGEDRPQSILTEETVREIRYLRKRDIPYHILAKRYGVTTNAIVSIFEGLTWSHVTGEPSDTETLDKVTHVKPKWKNAASAARHGENSPTAKLNNEKVIEIRKLRSEGMILSDIAAKFGLTAPCVHNVVRFRTWAHVKSSYDDILCGISGTCPT